MRQWDTLVDSMRETPLEVVLERFWSATGQEGQA